MLTLLKNSVETRNLHPLRSLILPIMQKRVLKIMPQMCEPKYKKISSV